MDILELRVADRLLEDLSDLLSHLEGAVAAHVLQRRQPLLGGSLGQAGNGVLEHPAVVLVHRELLTGMPLRLDEAPDAE